MLDARQKLIKELDKACGGRSYPREVVDFILARQRKIVEPLIANQDTAFGKICELKAVKQTLKNAGVE